MGADPLEAGVGLGRGKDGHTGILGGPAPPRDSAQLSCQLSQAEALARPLDALHTSRRLLEGHVPGEIRGTVLGLLIDAERREAAVVGRAEPLLRDVLGGGHQVAGDPLGGLDRRVQRGPLNLDGVTPAGLTSAGRIHVLRSGVLERAPKEPQGAAT